MVRFKLINAKNHRFYMGYGQCISLFGGGQGGNAPTVTLNYLLVYGEFVFKSYNLRSAKSLF